MGRRGRSDAYILHTRIYSCTYIEPVVKRFITTGSDPFFLSL